MIDLTRREFLASAAAAAALVPSAGLAKSPKRGGSLRFILIGDLKILDPIWTTAYITRDHGYMIWDTLFAQDAPFQIKPQMVDKYTQSRDGMISADALTPAVNAGIAGGGEKGWFGWSSSAELEKLRMEWIRTGDPAKRKQLAEQIQIVAFDEVPYVTWGQYVQPSLYRKAVRGVLQFPAALLWNVWVEG